MLPNEPLTTEFDEVELRIFRSRTAPLRAELRLPNEERLVASLGPPQRLNENDPREYGRQLFDWLFQDQLRDGLRRVRWGAESYSRSQSAVSGIRVRLWVDPEATELRNIRFEAMRDSDPTRDEPLALTLCLSRFVNVRAPRPAVLRFSPLRMLLITSNPPGPTQFHLEDIDVELEKKMVLGAVTEAGPPVEVVRLGPRPTLDDIQSAQSNPFHIVHLLAHAVARGGYGVLLLANADGTVQEVGCDEIARAIVSGPNPPALVYLATPLEGTEQDESVRISLAQILIEAGVQAVVAIQSPISPDRLRLFTDRFYRVLLQTGVVDRAISDARVAIYKVDTWDWAYPVLYMRHDVSELWTAESPSAAAVKGIRFQRS